MTDRDHTSRPTYRWGYTSGAFQLLALAARIAGRRVSGAVAKLVARAYCAAEPAVVDVVSRNLTLLTGRNDPAEKVFENFAITLADYFHLSGKSQAETFDLVDIVGTLPKRTDGRGAVLATGHYGFFELGALVMSVKGFNVSVITDSEPSPALSRWRADYRKRWGAETIDLGTDAFSSLRASKAIESGRYAAMLVDRPMGERFVNVPVPGGAIRFSMAPALLSWLVGCPVIPVSVRRTALGRYEVRTGDPVFAERSMPRDEALELCTRRMADSLIHDFSQDPLQWYQFAPLSS